MNNNNNNNYYDEDIYVTLYNHDFAQVELFFFYIYMSFVTYHAVDYFVSGLYKENIAIDFYYWLFYNSPSPFNDENGYNKRIWGCTYDEYVRKMNEKNLDKSTTNSHKQFEIDALKDSLFGNEDYISPKTAMEISNGFPHTSALEGVSQNFGHYFTSATNEVSSIISDSKKAELIDSNEEGASFFLFNPNELNEVIMWPLNLPLPCSEMMNGMVKLYLNSMSINISIFLAVLWLMIEALKTSSISMPESKSWGKAFYTDVKKKAYLFYSYPTHYEVWEEHLIDIYAIVVPTLIVLNQIVPTLGFLYNEEFLFYENVIGFEVNLIGNQWFWTYEYIIDLKVDEESFSWHPYFKFYYMFEDDFKKSINLFFSYNSVLIETDNRLLDVDKTLVLPIHTNVLFNFTSRDVIHSWALPQMGIKMDCVPGRVTNILFNSYSIGVYYGQCSELCGPLHGFMPICVEVLLPDYFVIWALLEAKLYSPDFNFSYYDIIKKLEYKDYTKYNLVKLT